MEENINLDQLLPEHSIHTDVSSVTQENEAVNYNLLDRLDKDELMELRKYFYEKKIDEKVKEPKGSAHPRFLGFKLTKNEFVDAVNKIIGDDTYSLTAAKLFDDITKDNWEQHQGFIWWEQVLDAIIENIEGQTFHRKWDVIREPLSILYTIQHCRRETIIRVVPIETDTSFCYVIVSKYGRIGLYDWRLQLLEQYEVKLGAQVVSPLLSTEVHKTTWLTDAVYLQDAVILLLSASDRSLHFYSASGLVHVPTFYISGLPNIPTCLSYTPGPTSDDPSVLFIGDDHGSIITLKFHQAEYCLFQRNNSDKMDTYFWKELENQTEWVTTSIDNFVHRDEVIKIEYFSDNNSIVSCSNDPNATLVIRHLTGKRAPYIFKISRGVRCFHLDRVLKLIATGSKDSVVRLWNPVMTKKPIGSLFGHRCAVVDVRIIRNHEAVLSMSKDATLMVWDIQDQCCLQVLQALFPGYHEVGRTADFGVQTFYPGPIRSEPPLGKGPKLPLTEPTIQKSHPASLLSSTTSDTKKERRYQEDRESVDKNTRHENKIASNSTAENRHRVSTINITNLENVQVTTTQNDNEDYQYTPTENTRKSLTVVTDEHLNQDEAVFFDEDDVRGAKRMLASQWNRLEVLAACCNYIVILYLGDGEIREQEDFMSGEPLPPPLREQDPAIPSPWLTADTPSLHLLHEVDSISQGSSTPDLPLTDSTAESIYNHLSYNTEYHFKPVMSPQHSHKAAKAKQATTQRDVRAMVEQCAPHLALNISQLEEIKITQRLPITVHTHNLDLSNPEKLLKSKIKRNSTGTPTADSKSSNMPLDP